MSDRVELPYPHRRNDCERCRERDADFHLLGPELNIPGKRAPVYCRRCIGEYLVVAAISRPGDVDLGALFQVELRMLPPNGAGTGEGPAEGPGSA